MEAMTWEALDRLHRLLDSAPLTMRETALFLRSSVSTLEAMRSQGTGPTYMQLGAKSMAGSSQKCLYQKGDLLAWLEVHKVRSVRQAALRKGQF